MSNERLYEYDEETTIDPNCICSICNEPLEKPSITPCEHVFCRPCIEGWLIRQHNGTCPTCRQVLSLNDLRKVMRPFRNILDAILVICTQCGLRGIQRGNFRDHIVKQCPKSIQRCKATDLGCLWTGPRDEMDRHLAECEFERRRATLELVTQENAVLRNELQHINNERETLSTRLSSLNDELRTIHTAYPTRPAQPVLQPVEVRPQLGEY